MIKINNMNKKEKVFMWRQKNGSVIPITKLSDDRLLQNFNSCKERLETKQEQLKSVSGGAKKQLQQKCNNLEIAMLATQQELDRRNIIIC